MTTYPKFTRKDFQFIAYILFDSKPNVLREMKNQWNETTKIFSQRLKCTNPDFDEHKFLKECGYYDNNS